MAADDVDFAGKGQKKGVGQKVRNCCNSIWNSQKKEFLGRTGSSWAKIGVFYVIFYSCLAGFFAIMLVGFFATLDDKSPTMTNMYSLIKQNPGMGFRPMYVKDSTLIKVNTADKKTYEKDVEDIVDYLRINHYLDESNHTTNFTADSAGNKLFDVSEAMKDGCEIKPDLHESFGYHDGTPCIMLKINKVFGWEPKNFDNESLEFEKEAKAAIGGNLTTNWIGVSCEGENDGDVDNLGNAVFTPNGFSFEWYPYMNLEHYRAPIVFVRFPNMKYGVVIQVWCKLWVKNIKHHKNDKAGSVHFELLVDHNRTRVDGSSADGSKPDGSR